MKKMKTDLPYTIHPLGDAALLVDYGNRIDEKINDRVSDLFHLLQQHTIPGIIEAVPAYSSLAVYYDVEKIIHAGVDQKTAFERVKEKIETFMALRSEQRLAEHRHFKIPVCYYPTYGTDLLPASEFLKIPVEEIIRLHTAKTYRVYMMGFLPGFPYMGMVHKKLILPRKSVPTRVQAGSIGIAGSQTGIYPLDSPGGWQIIGQTPLRLFDKEKENPVLLRGGDLVTFYAITVDEFENQ
jgi:inhibitor of KinA